MKYSNFVKGNEGFQYSINIQYDLMNPNKISGYIPTKKSLEILNQYLINAIIEDGDRASVLIGPYGKGKSHLLLILLSLMCGTSNKEMDDLVEKISRVNDQCGEFAKDVLNKKKYLPIVINFNSGDLNQAFLIALNEALKNENIEDILPNTFFDSAINVLNGWEEYEHTISIVEKLVLDKYRVDLNTFKGKLKSFDIEAYKVFKSIFLQVTSGVEFNPLINTDVVKLYEETNYLLKEKYNYDGMVIVFDEFSKFIEASTDLNNTLNLKILQDFAELTGRSKSPQMHLICVTHKTINEYISKIPQDKIDAWRTIEGRFKEILFTSSSQQNYELISNAIVKDLNRVKEVLDNEGLNNSEEVWAARELFELTDSEFEKEIVEGCFPLNPYSTYALPVISEKVAQNERTLFTYLSKDEPNSLIDLINDENQDFKLVTIDKLYDYFEPLFKKETFNEAIHDIWLKTDTALKIVYSENEKRIIKALGIIYIINDFKVLSPNEKTLSNILSLDKNYIKETIKNLRDLNILLLRKSNETLDFIPISNVDINSKIKSLVETKFKSVNLNEVFNELVNLKYVLPKKYNDDYKVTRYFKRSFMLVEQMTAYKNAEKILKDFNADGVIIDLIWSKKEDIQNAKEWINDIDDSRIVLVVPDESLKIEEDLKEYKAISYLKEDVEFLKEDAAIESQLEILLDDVREKIVKYINNSYNINDKMCSVYIDNEERKQLKPYELSRILSEICEKNYYNSPIINNELINKNEISAPIKKARNIIVDMLLDDSYLDFKYDKNAVECTLFRATIVNKGLLENERNFKADMKPLLGKIKEFIISADKKEMNFSALYNEVTTNANKIRARRGVLPIYLAYVLKDYKDDIIIYLKSGRSKKELILDTHVIENINANPENYIIKLEEGTVEKDKYVTDLLHIFEGYINKTSNNKFVDIIYGMKRWIQSLSLYSQNHKINLLEGIEVSSEIIKLRNELVKFEINYRSFIFNDLLKHLKVNSFDECIEKLKVIKDYLYNHDDMVREYLIGRTKDIINKDYKGTLKSALVKWYGELSQEQKDHLYNTESNEFLKIIENSTNNEIEIINRLAYNFSSLMIEDWNDNTVDIYIEGIKNSKNTIEEYESACDKDGDEGLVKILIESQDKNIVEKTFNKVEISPLGSTLLNAMEEVIEEYGDSIDDNEKRNILMDILSRYI